MKNALILVDIQMDYFSPEGKYPLDDSIQAVDAAKRLLAHFRKRNLPIFHIKHLSPVGFPLLVDGTPGTKHHPSVAPTQGETIIEKQTPNAFFQTQLATLLTSSGVECVTIVGFMANMCVDATARAAKEHGFAVEIVPEAVAAASIGDVTAKNVKTAFLGALNGFLASIIPIDEKLVQL